MYGPLKHTHERIRDDFENISKKALSQFLTYLYRPDHYLDHHLEALLIENDSAYKILPGNYMCGSTFFPCKHAYIPRHQIHRRTSFLIRPNVRRRNN